MSTAGRPGGDITVLGDGPRDLLLLHGLGGDRNQPLGIAQRAATVGWRLIAPDLRAHGDSSLDGAARHLTFDRLTRDVEEVLLAVGTRPRPTVVMGISMGAGVALRLAIRHRVDVRGLVLVRPAWLHEPHPPGLAPFPVIADLLRSHGPVDGARRFRLSTAFRDIARVFPAAAEALVGQFALPCAVERSTRLDRLPASTPYRAGDLRQLELPAVVVTSPADPVHPRPLAQHLHQALPGSALVEVPARYDDPGGHQRAVIRHLEKFLQDRLDLEQL